MENLLTIKNLSTTFDTFEGTVYALNGVSLSVKYGEAVGIVGESGSGKSVTMLSLLKLLSENGKINTGEISFSNKKLNDFNHRQMQKIRGKEIGMIFQDPMTSLNPLFTIGNQMIEAIKCHQKISKSLAQKKIIEMLNLVGITIPERRIKQYPHELSGGMRQRVMIAMALLGEPKLLIADEPTTALDVTIQAQIIELLKSIKEKLKMSIILITHDLGVVTELCTRIFIMYGGMIVEEGSINDIYYNPKHPYTIALLKSIPRFGKNKKRLTSIDGNPPNLMLPLIKCPFAQRCLYSMQICLKLKPEYFKINGNHHAACWLLHKYCKEEEV